MPHVYAQHAIDDGWILEDLNDLRVMQNESISEGLRILTRNSSGAFAWYGMVAGVREAAFGRLYLFIRVQGIQFTVAVEPYLPFKPARESEKSQEHGYS